MTTAYLQISGASLTYDEKIIFRNIELNFPAGKWIALLGPSGIGKSAFLRLLAGLIKSTKNIHAYITVNHHGAFHQQIAYMAQADLLLPWLTVLGNATLGLKLRSLPKTLIQQEKEKAIALLIEVGLEKVITHYPQQLSGGMRQRVALVRTLMENKSIVLMDEPFSALDAITRYKLQELASQYLKDKTVLFVTHDPMEAIRLADYIYIMQGQPAHLKSVAHLTSAIPRELNDPDLVTLHTQLFHELSQAVEMTI